MVVIDRIAPKENCSLESTGRSPVFVVGKSLHAYAFHIVLHTDVERSHVSAGFMLILAHIRNEHKEVELIFKALVEVHRIVL